MWTWTNTSNINQRQVEVKTLAAFVVPRISVASCYLVLSDGKAGHVLFKTFAHTAVRPICTNNHVIAALHDVTISAFERGDPVP